MIDLDAFEGGVASGDRTVLARAITLIESTKPEHQQLSRELLRRLHGRMGQARRVGITGVPGSGKSTFIEALGLRLAEAGHKVGVLAVDPSSALTGGSILGDKTRMPRLSNHPRAFVRPSPSGGTLGGVAQRTRECIGLLEAAGHDLVLVETVGVGQSETMVAEMVDFFLLLVLPGAGDELQGIKRGVLERVDLVVVNKADGDNVERAERAKAEYALALRILRGATGAPLVLSMSARTGAGVDSVWTSVRQRLDELSGSGALHEKRKQQLVRWMWSLVEERLVDALRRSAAVAEVAVPLEGRVAMHTASPSEGADAILAAFLREKLGSGAP